MWATTQARRADLRESRKPLPSTAAGKSDARPWRSPFSTGSPSPSASSNRDRRRTPTAQSAPAPTTRPPHAATRPATRTAGAMPSPSNVNGHRVQGRIQQHRMHAESSRHRPPLVGSVTSAKNSSPRRPQRGQPLERRAVLVAARRQPLVAVGHIDGESRLQAATPTGRRPARPAPLDNLPRRMGRPMPESEGSPGVYGHTALAGFAPASGRCPHGVAPPPAVRRPTLRTGSSNGACNVKLVDHRASRPRPPARMANSTKPAPGNTASPVDSVIGQPTLGGRRQPARQHHPARVR